MGDADIIDAFIGLYYQSIALEISTNIYPFACSFITSHTDSFSAIVTQIVAPTNNNLIHLSGTTERRVINLTL
jgi:hypothetical protein